jgi:hypothetical protein
MHVHLAQQAAEAEAEAATAADAQAKAEATTTATATADNGTAPTADDTVIPPAATSPSQESNYVRMLKERVAQLETDVATQQQETETLRTERVRRSKCACGVCVSFFWGHVKKGLKDVSSHCSCHGALRCRTDLQKNCLPW